MRKYYLDNLRYGIVLLVIFYHIIYLFNSLGVITNVVIPGIPQMDVFLYLIYPWFMPCLFLISGISAKYALEKKSGKQFLKEKIRKILIPSIAGIFMIGWISGYITNQYANMFAGNTVPGIFKYFIYSFSGIGPLWFAHELFLAYLILLLIRKIDKNNKLAAIGRKVNFIVLLFLVFAVWGSSLILNTPVIEIYRNGIYIFMFLLGYYVFSQDHVIEILQKYKYLLLAVSVVIGIIYTIYFWGQNYSLMKNLQHPLTNAYAWFMSLALLGCAKTWFDKDTAFSRYMRPRNFGFYVLHYPLLVTIAYLIDRNFNVKPIMFYLILAILEAIFLPIAYEIISRIPIIRTLILGIRKKK